MYILCKNHFFLEFQVFAFERLHSNYHEILHAGKATFLENVFVSYNL